MTEEVWSWWQDGSIHRSPWPSVDELPPGGDPAIVDDVATVLSAVRRAKSEAKVSMKAEVASVELIAPEATGDRLRQAQADLLAAGRIASMEYRDGAELQVDVRLAT